MQLELAQAKMVWWEGWGISSRRRWEEFWVKKQEMSTLEVKSNWFLLMPALTSAIMRMMVMKLENGAV